MPCESSMNIGAGLFLGAFIWCFFPAASVCNHTSQRKGEQSFGYDVYNGLVFKMEFFSRTSPPVLCFLFLIWGLADRPSVSFFGNIQQDPYCSSYVMRYY